MPARSSGTASEIQETMSLMARPFIGIILNPEEGAFTVKKSCIEAVCGAGGLPVCIPPHGDPKEYFRRFQGILIPGGADIHPSCYGEGIRLAEKIVPVERTAFEIGLVNESVRTGKPLLSICYGMQLANVALGGSLYQDISERQGALRHREGTHQIALDDEFLGRGEFEVNSHHHQACRTVATPLKVIARAPDGIVEAFRLEGHPFFTGVQWHPERMPGEGLACNIFAAFIEASAREKL